MVGVRLPLPAGPSPRQLWGTFGLSVALHALLVAAVILMPRFRIGAYITVPVTYTVSLVGAPPGGSRGGGGGTPGPPPSAAPAAAPAAPAAPATRAARPAPAPRSSEELTLPGRRPVKSAPTQEEATLRPPSLGGRTSPERRPPRPAPAVSGPPAPAGQVPGAAAPAVPGAVASATPGAGASGAPGNGGGGNGKGNGVEITGTGTGGGSAQGYYFTLVQSKVEETWNLLNAGVPPESSVVVQMRIMRSGQVRDIQVVTSSGVNAIDMVALRAIRQSQPLPPFPNLLTDPSLDVRLRFVIEGKRSGA